MSSAEELPHLAEFSEVLKSPNTESARGAVLISTAMLDELLRRTLAGFLIEHPDNKKLFEGFNPPSRLSFPPEPRGARDGFDIDTGIRRAFDSA